MVVDDGDGDGKYDDPSGDMILHTRTNTHTNTHTHTMFCYSHSLTHSPDRLRRIWYNKH